MDQVSWLLVLIKQWREPCMVSRPSWIRRLRLPGFCSVMSWPCRWCDWIKNNSYGMSIDVWFVSFSNFIIPSIVPYSCWLFSMCCAKADIKEFASDCEVHSVNTRHRSDLYPPPKKLTRYQKWVYYSGIKIFNHLPQNIKSLSSNVKKFKLALKRFLLMGSFYTLDEYFDWISRSDLGTFV
jgi:hypothetical protein